MAGHVRQAQLVEKAGHVDFTAFDPSIRHPLRIRTRDYVTERQEKMMAQDRS